MGIVAPTPILSLPVATGIDNTYWVPTSSTNGSPTERVNVVTLSGLQGNLDQITNIQGSVLYRGALQWDGLGPGTAGYVLSTQGPDANPTWVPNTAGSVTSVGLALPGSLFSVSGSPVTSSGTLTGDLITQSANQVFAGPATGSDAVPTFRSLVNADILGGGVALTKTDDTNVTLTLGGDASTSLVNAASLTLGWTGQLSVPRGGTGQATLGAHGILVGAGASGVNVTGTGSIGQILTSNGSSADPTFQDGATVLGKALTTADDTNITLTLGGSPTTALLAASSITAGWTGLLGLGRGGTNADLSATGGASQVLRQSSTGAAITVSQLSASDIASGQALTRTNDTNVTLTLGGASSTALLAATSLTMGWSGTLAVSRGGIGVGTLTSHGVLLGQGTSAVSASAVGATGSVLAGNTGTDPTFQTVASLLDTIGATQGNVLYRGASGWSTLAPGTNGQVLTTGGASANPSWTSVGGTGTVTSVAVSGGTTGLTTSGGPITGSGTITIAGTLAAANGGTGITSLGSGVATFLGTPSSANLAAAVTGETGSGALVFGTGPTLSAPVLGTPASGTLTNCTGLPLLTGVSGRTGPTVQVFTSSGTWTKPTGCVKIKATIVGAGGGGGGVKASSSSNGIVGGGGGSGALCETYIDVTSISSLAVTVGAFGAGGSSAGLTGSSGGTSGLGTANANGQATGGIGGGGSSSGSNSVYTNAGGAPGVATNGTINIAGNSGFGGIMVAQNQGISGTGGSSALGGAAAGVRFFNNNTGLAGTDATAAGSGGSGAVASGTTTGYAGGNGSDGIVIIEEYYA